VTPKNRSKGVYRIDLTRDVRTRHEKTPVVIAGAVGSKEETGSDNVFSVYGVRLNEFYVSSLDVAPREGTVDRGYYPQNADFSFIAISEGPNSEPETKKG
jgi:hypothetical protein